MKKVLYLFSHLDDADVDWMSQQGRPERVARGSAVIKEGEEAPSVFVLLEGALSVSTQGAGEIGRLEWGEIVGEMSLVDGRSASASVTATEDAQVLRLDRARLSERLGKDAGFGHRFYRGVSLTLSERLRSTLQQLDKRGAANDNALDELNPALLDHLHLAGARFDRLLKATLRKSR